MAMQRRTRILGAAALGGPMGRATPAQAEAGPVRQKGFVVPFATGGGQDVSWRILPDRRGRRLRATCVVGNRGGVGGGLSAQEVVRVAPDGGPLEQMAGPPATLPSTWMVA